MKGRIFLPAPTLMLLLFVAGFFSGRACLAQDAGLAGWGPDSPYNGYFKPDERDVVKGVVEDMMDVTPLPGMAPGIGMTVIDQDKDRVTVQLGPKSFVKPDGIGLKKGAKVKVRGAWADIAGKEVFIAAKVKTGEESEMKLRRTSDGKPYWAMSAEEIKKVDE